VADFGNKWPIADCTGMIRSESGPDADCNGLTWRDFGLMLLATGMDGRQTAPMQDALAGWRTKVATVQSAIGQFGAKSAECSLH